MQEFHVLTIGHFSRNRFWGESDTEAYRDALCTCTLIKGENNIVVDPSETPEQMARTLYNRSGLRPEAVNTVFLTHAHGDHFAGLECFENAEWIMSGADLALMRRSADERERRLATRIAEAKPGFSEGIALVELPGHTMGTTGLLLETQDGKVCVCGDSIMTRDFFKARLGYYNSVDFTLSSASIQKVAQLADIVVPGHDNYFLTHRGTEK